MQIFNISAIYIQKIWRGYYARKLLNYYLEIEKRGLMQDFNNFQVDS